MCVWPAPRKRQQGHRRGGCVALERARAAARGSFAEAIVLQRPVAGDALVPGKPIESPAHGPFRGFRSAARLDRLAFPLAGAMCEASTVATETGIVALPFAPAKRTVADAAGSSDHRGVITAQTGAQKRTNPVSGHAAWTLFFLEDRRVVIDLGRLRRRLHFLERLQRELRRIERRIAYMKMRDLLLRRILLALGPKPMDRRRQVAHPDHRLEIVHVIRQELRDDRQDEKADAVDHDTGRVPIARFVIPLPELTPTRLPLRHHLTPEVSRRQTAQRPPKRDLMPDPLGHEPVQDFPQPTRHGEFPTRTLTPKVHPYTLLYPNLPNKTLVLLSGLCRIGSSNGNASADAKVL